MFLLILQKIGLKKQMNKKYFSQVQVKLFKLIILGHYNIVAGNANEKVVVSSANEDIKIVEVPKP